MIVKFKHIKNLGRFRKFLSTGDQTLRKLNLFFGENGRGKTTIASILRSLSSGDPAFLHERQTLGSAVQPDIEIILDSGNSKFNGSTWTLPYADVKIFDQNFITENIHVGESVETDNLRGLASVILGQRGAEISKQIKQYDELAREKLNANKNAQQEIEKLIPSIRGVKIMTLANFINLPDVVDIDLLISDKQKELEAVQRAASLRLQQNMAALPVPSLPTDFAQTLLQTLEDISADAEAKVRAHLQESHVKNAKDWISDGVEFMSGTTCPVCGQSIEGIELIAAYKKYFSGSYSALKKRVGAMIERINDMLGSGYEKRLKETMTLNATTIAFWSEIIPSLVLPALPDISEIKIKRDSLIGSAMILVLKKEESLLEPLSSESLDPLIQELNSVSKKLNAYNEAVTMANVKIAEVKSKTESANIAEVEKELTQLKLTKTRYSSEVITILGTHDTSKAQREQAVAARLAAQEELSKYSRQVVGACETKINEILSDFGVGYKIRGVETTFPAGTAASTYSIEINGETVEAGKSRPSAPSFQTMLSAGDKSALALAFFFATLDQDPGKTDKIILLDDPFNSQDEHRRNQTNKLIHKYAAECAQVLISSHNPDFLRLIWDTSNSATTKCLKLARDGVDDTIIEEWDIEHSTKHPYLRLHHDLTQYMDGTLALSLADVIQKPRPLLEDYIRFRFPNVFQWNHWLGDMVANFKAAGSSHPMHTHIQSLTDINDYTKGSHHTNNTINESELRAHVKKTLDIVGKT